MRRSWLVLLTAVPLTAAACVGEVVNLASPPVLEAVPPPDAMVGPGAPPPGPASGVQPAAADCGPGRFQIPRRIWRLTPGQVVNTLRAVPELADASLSPPPLRDPTDGLYVNQPATMRLDFPDRFPAAESYMTDVAERLVAALVTTGACAKVDRACVSTFLDRRLPRLWRRPVSPAEMTALMQVHDAITGSEDHKARFTLLAALLASGFWYRTELGQTTGSTKLGPFEQASLLSYGLTDGPPDDELWADAIAGKLTGADALARHARRLVQAGKHLRGLSALFRDWLDYKVLDGRDGVGDVPLTAARRTALLRELDLFVAERVKAGGDLASYFTTPRIFVSQDNAVFYGRNSASADLIAADIDPSERQGLFTLAGTLIAPARESEDHNFIFRGTSFLNKFACEITPAPPAGLNLETTPVKTGMLSSKQIKQQHSSVPACAGCHALVDPVGLAFESYDIAGRYRTRDENGPIDSSGTVRIGAETFTFANGAEFVRQFALSSRFGQCAAARVADYLVGLSGGGGGPPGSACVVQNLLAGRPVPELGELAARIYASESLVTRSE